MIIVLKPVDQLAPIINREVESFATEFWPCERFLDTTDSFAEKNSKLIASGVEELWKVIGELQELRVMTFTLINSSLLSASYSK